MEDTRISFETAKLAKQKGFDIVCKNQPYFKDNEPDGWDSDRIEKPTQSLLQRWLREEHDVDIIPPLRFNPDGYACSIFHNKNTKFFSTYEKCLEKELQKRLKPLPNKI